MAYSQGHTLRCERTRNRDGSMTSWFKCLKALDDLGGVAKSSEIYKKAFGRDHVRSAALNGLFAGMNGVVMNFNKSIQCWEISDKGREVIAEDAEREEARTVAEDDTSSTDKMHQIMDLVKACRNSGYTEFDILSAVHQAINECGDDVNE